MDNKYYVRSNLANSIFNIQAYQYPSQNVRRINLKKSAKILAGITFIACYIILDISKVAEADQTLSCCVIKHFRNTKFPRSITSVRNKAEVLKLTLYCFAVQMKLMVWQPTVSSMTGVEKYKDTSSPESILGLDGVDELMEHLFDDERSTRAAGAAARRSDMMYTTHASRASSSSSSSSFTAPPNRPDHPQLQPRPFHPLYNGPTKVLIDINLGTVQWKPHDHDLQEEYLWLFSSQSQLSRRPRSYTGEGASSRYPTTTGHHAQLSSHQHQQHQLNWSNSIAIGESSLTDAKIRINLNTRNRFSSPNSTKRSIDDTAEDFKSDPRGSGRFSNTTYASATAAAAASSYCAIGDDSSSSKRRRVSSSKESQIRNKEWQQRYEELIAYKAKYGNCLVPYNWPQNKQLANWVKRQRYQYNQMNQFHMHTTLTPKRIDLLNSIGFTWNSHEASWEEKYHLLLQFHQHHGHSNVPPNYNQNRDGLATWVKYQRRLYKILMGKKGGGGEDGDEEEEDEQAIDDDRKRPHQQRQQPPSSSSSQGPPATLTKDRLQKLMNLDFNFDPCDRLNKQKQKKQKTNR